jgi:hypothetical protein
VAAPWRVELNKKRGELGYGRVECSAEKNEDGQLKGERRGGGKLFSPEVRVDSTWEVRSVSNGEYGRNALGKYKNALVLGITCSKSRSGDCGKCQQRSD